MRSYSPSNRRPSSRSPRRRKIRKAKPHTTIHVLEKRPESKSAPVPAPESAPVIPLSDSPPPSRWKPGQKPWKPSYVHIQEIKVSPSKTCSTGQKVDSVAEEADTSQRPGDSDIRTTHKPAQHSHSRSPRSRSNSRSSSKSRSRSPDVCHSRPECENSQKTSSRKKKSLDREWKAYYSSLNRIKNVDKYLSITMSQDAQPESPDVSNSLENFKKDGETQRHSTALPEGWKDRSEWDSDSSSGNQTKAHQQTLRELPDKTFAGVTGWNSESDPENVTSRSFAISEKEEGEASSESDGETSRKAVVAGSAAGHKGSSGVSEKCPEKAAEPERHKSKKKAKRKHKHKSKGESKTRRSKDKTKRSKKKPQRLKETFHWQPPLEFGEEEDEDESTRDAKERPAAHGRNEEVQTFNKDMTREENRGQQRFRQSTGKNPKQSSSRSDSPSAQVVVSGGDMDICTPEHDAETIVEASGVNNAPELTVKPASSSLPQPHGGQQSSVTTATAAAELTDAPGTVIHFKWKPLKGTGSSQNTPPLSVKNMQLQLSRTAEAQGVRMEIKSKSRVRPGSLFDEVRKTVRLNRRPRNQESSSEERSPSAGKTRGKSHTRSRKKSRSGTRNSRSASSQRSRSRGWSHSYSRSRSRSASSSYSSRLDSVG